MAKQTDLDRMYSAWRDLATIANKRLPAQQLASKVIQSRANVLAGSVKGFFR